MVHAAENYEADGASQLNCTRLCSALTGARKPSCPAENYQADGVLFRGNLRGDPDAAYAKMAARLKVLLL